MVSMTVTETPASAGVKRCFGETRTVSREADRKDLFLLPPLVLPSPSGPPLADPNKEPGGKGEMGFAESPAQHQKLI